MDVMRMRQVKLCFVDVIGISNTESLIKIRRMLGQEYIEQRSEEPIATIIQSLDFTKIGETGVSTRSVAPTVMRGIPNGRTTGRTLWVTM
jgi:hypothetical protein